MIPTSDNPGDHDAAIETIGKFVEELYDVDSPFEFATTLVKATARHYKADIATLFRVSPSKTELVAEAGYDQRGEQLKARAIYNLPWEAKSEHDMSKGGLTAWVAVSGNPLFIENAEDLLNKHLHPAHRGAWDTELHPESPRKTFGCLYAVPLRIRIREGKQLVPRESVIGVYKIERRKDNPEGVFTAGQIKEFDMLARQFTLVITLYERAMLRILSDARHAVAGRLADTISQLDIISSYLQKREQKSLEQGCEKAAACATRAKDDADRVLSWLRQALQTYSHPLDQEKRKLAEFMNDTLGARAAQGTSVPSVIAETDARQLLRLLVSQSWDLHTVLLSLLNNAIQHSGVPGSVTVAARIERLPKTGTEETLTNYVFTVEDRGRGLSVEAVEAAKKAVAPGTEGGLTEVKGTGLRRVFRVCGFRKWRVNHQVLNPGTRFEITVPIRS